MQIRVFAFRQHRGDCTSEASMAAEQKEEKDHIGDLKLMAIPTDYCFRQTNGVYEHHAASVFIMIVAFY